MKGRTAAGGISTVARVLGSSGSVAGTAFISAIQEGHVQ